MIRENRMRIAVICFTGAGEETARRVRDALDGEAVRLCRKYTARRTDGMETPGISGNDGIDKSMIIDLKESVQEWTGMRFADSDAIVFVGAVGIAVRSIAPFLTSKTVDPAILCIDEKATWVIPLASGHLGGANALARRIAQATGAEAVITTATDLNDVFAVDVFAKENNLYLSSIGRAKEVSAALLAGETVGLILDPELTWTGELPAGLELWGQGNPMGKDGQGGLFSKNGIRISFRTNAPVIPRKRILELVPRVLTLGVGCKKDTDPNKLKRFLLRILQESGLSMDAFERLCSIDQKREEPALVRFAGQYGIPFETFSAQELAHVPGSFSASAFVQQTVGVDNVCERSAVLGAAQGDEPGKLILSKQSGDGMTVAVAARACRLRF